MADKIVTDNILEKATEGIIQLIADNIFEFESYNDTEIAELFSLTPEEAQHISDLIADTVISQYKLWSSKKVSDELLSAKNECNDYTDTRLANISSISLKYCTALPSVGESNCIYILKSTDSNPDTLNLYDGTWISIGRFTISLDDYYTKAQIDTKLDLKADKTEILAQDDVITDTSLATTTNVLSATTTIDELDKKVDKTSIVTSISSTSTDDTVPSAKAVYDNCIKDNNIKTYTDITQLGLTTPTTTGEIFNAMPNDSICRIASLNYSKVSDTPTDYGILKIDKSNMYSYDIEFKRSKSNIVTGNYLWIGQLRGDDGTGLTWKRVCSTSVADVEVTEITTFTDSDVNGKVIYSVKNGICYVTLLGLYSTTVKSNIKVCGLPSATTKPHVPLLSATKGKGQLGIGFLGADGMFTMHIFIANDGIYTSFSYPVAES